jgi:hypothetical protein
MNFLRFLFFVLFLLFCFVYVYDFLFVLSVLLPSDNSIAVSNNNNNNKEIPSKVYKSDGQANVEAPYAENSNINFIGKFSFSFRSPYL